MKIRLSVIVVLLLLVVSTYGQIRLTQAISRVNVHVFPTGINYSREIPIANNSTIEGSLGISSHYYLRDFAFQLRSNIAVEYKFYYNINSRKDKGKNIHGNSASFIGATAFSDLFPLYKLDQSNNENFLFCGAIFWGIRQQIKDSGFQFNFRAGPAYASRGISNKNPALYLATGISYMF